MEINFSLRSKKQLKQLNLRFQSKIIDSLKKFEKGKKIDIKRLKGRNEEYRIRIGNYRIILNQIKEKKFLVTKIGVRENIYLIFF